MTMDADLQNDPADIPAFLAALAQGWDCVCGTRVATRGQGDKFHPRRLQPHRQLGPQQAQRREDFRRRLHLPRLQA
jgi:hypothetical protein